MGRRELREQIFKLLFLTEFHNSEEMPEQIKIYFDSLDPIEDKNRIYIEEKFANIMKHKEEIDQLIEAVSRGWKISRMGKVDISLLRLAVYEINYDEDVPVRVAINEAVELSKKFAGDESYSFINGILGKVVS